jgi:hypothetical protein
MSSAARDCGSARRPLGTEDPKQRLRPPARHDRQARLVGGAEESSALGKIWPAFGPLAPNAERARPQTGTSAGRAAPCSPNPSDVKNVADAFKARCPAFQGATMPGPSLLATDGSVRRSSPRPAPLGRIETEALSAHLRLRPAAFKIARCGKETDGVTAMPTRLVPLLARLGGTLRR